MALTNCKGGGREISSAATVCLNYRAPNHWASRDTTRTGSGWRWFTQASLGLLAAIMLLASVPEVSANSAATSPETTNIDPVTEAGKDKIVTELNAPPAVNLEPNPHQVKVLNMTEEMRRALLKKVILSRGAKCSRVTRTFYQGADDKENHIWSAACAQGGSFSITVYNDVKGSTGVVDCGVLVAVSGVSCFESLSK